MSSAKTCGTCTLCCKVMGIKDIAKPVGEWCPHCSPGVGCGLYPAHPSSCKHFACLWLESTDLPDSYRPDRTKVVLLNDQESGRLIAHCDPNVPAPWRREPIYPLLMAAASTRWATGGLVIAVSGSTQWLITATDDLDMGRIDAGIPIASGKHRTANSCSPCLCTPTASNRRTSLSEC